jgi:hypothetical protein
VNSTVRDVVIETLSRAGADMAQVGIDQIVVEATERIEVTLVPDETPFLVCINCGEAFDNITSAYEHGYSDVSGSAGWCGDEGFNIVPESEAF